MKTCTRCGESKPLSDFYRMAKAKNGLNPKCKPCINAYNAAYHAAHKQEMVTWHRNTAVRRWAKLYLGLEPGMYLALLARANGRCEVCGRTSDATSRYGKEYQLHLDHDHETQKVRGILCRPCNVALGCVNDDPSILRKLAEYLEAGGIPSDDLVPVPVPKSRRFQSPTAETRAKIGAAQKYRKSEYKGVPRTPEVREKIGAAQRGKVISEESKQKMREARLRYLANRSIDLTSQGE